MKDKMEEACGIFGVYTSGRKEVGKLTYYALYALQHRGQESAGITVSNDGELTTYKGMGLASDVFTRESLDNLTGNAAIGHVRYSTMGESRIENAQPLENRLKLGQVAVAHNGNLTNSKIIRELLEDGGATFHTTIDSEVIIKLIARKANAGFEEAIKTSVSAIKGAFALVVLAGNKLIGVRDPYGIRPLTIGKNKQGDYFLASESCAIDAIGGEVIRDVGAGEMVVIDENGIRSSIYSEIHRMNSCSFEYIYFARPDSTIDEINVYETRVEAGKRLARQMKVTADIVIGVPDSGIPAAIGYAEESGIPYGIGLIKNKYIGRTFIAPSQELREQAVAVKLNPLKINLKNKRVVIIDDSLVRGTTSKKLVEIIRNAGAKEVHFRLASPPVRFPCFYGIDTARREELMANRHSIEEIRKEINADTLDYLTLESMIEAIGAQGEYCTGCFCGDYPICTPNE
jgi:amidophosphoribosyltransferase